MYSCVSPQTESSIVALCNSPLHCARGSGSQLNDSAPPQAVVAMATARRCAIRLTPSARGVQA